MSSLSKRVNTSTNHVNFISFDNDDMKPSKRQVTFLSLIYNGNWTEWSAIWSEIIRVIDLKSQVWFQTKIARHEVQLPIYYIHFEIAEFSQY